MYVYVPTPTSCKNIGYAYGLNLALYPGLLTSAFVACNTNAVETLLLSHV